MFALPARFAPLIVVFAPLFRQRTWRWAEQLLIGALLAPGVRTVTSVLCVVGLATERKFGKYHRVLSCAVWSSRTTSRLLLQLLVRTFVPTGTLVLGLDDTLERRRGARIYPRHTTTLAAADGPPHENPLICGIEWLRSTLATAPENCYR